MIDKERTYKFYEILRDEMNKICISERELAIKFPFIFLMQLCIKNKNFLVPTIIVWTTFALGWICFMRRIFNFPRKIKVRIM